MSVYYGISRNKQILTHYGRLGMKWGKHIFGDDSRWGINGRGKVSSHVGERFKTEIGEYDTEYDGKWSYLHEVMREAYYQNRDKKYPLSKLKRHTNKLSSPPSMDEVKAIAKKINPNGQKLETMQNGYLQNCVKCSVCTVLQLKGYDAVAYKQENNLGHPVVGGDQFFSERKALDLAHGGTVASVSFTLAKTDSKHAQSLFAASALKRRYKNAVDKLSAGLNDGDYGLVSSRNKKTGDGHATNFIKLNGKLYSIDSQIGVVEPMENYFDSVGWYVNDHKFVKCNYVSVNEVGVGRFVNEKQFKK